MNVVRGQETRGSAVHEVNPVTRRVWHRREIRSRSEGNLCQTPILQAVVPNIRQAIYRTGEKNGVPWFAPHDVSPIPGHLTQINRLVAGHVYSVEMEFGPKLLSYSSGEQLVATGKYQKREEEQTGALGFVNCFLVQSGLFRPKNLVVIRLHIINESAVGRWNRRRASHHTARSSTEGRHRPDLVLAERPYVIDFSPVGRKVVQNLVAFVMRELKRLSAGRQHEKYLFDAAHR